MPTLAGAGAASMKCVAAAGPTAIALLVPVIDELTVSIPVMGPHRSGDIADLLGRRVTSLEPTRSQLIAKGMIWSPSHGDTAFTVPLFDEFMRRIMPGDGWKL